MLDKLVTKESSEGTAPRVGRALFEATLPFAREDRAKSWSYLANTLLILLNLLCLASLVSWYPAKFFFSALAGLVIVRGFILYHDYLHGAILKNSRLAKYIMYTYGALLLAPPRSWKESHNFHHAHVGQVEHSWVGSFPIMTAERWQQATLWEKFEYCVARNPLVLATAYIFVFLVNICILPLFANLGKHWDSILSVVVHGGVAYSLWYAFGTEVLLFSFLLPLWIASAAGAYLFYVQHNADGLEILPEDNWNFYDAAVKSSSYLKLGPVMSWFTGNIGYHHIHHLNAKIPFYRLPETMEAVPELQNPVTTTLHPSQIWRSLQLKLWDAKQGRLITFKDLH